MPPDDGKAEADALDRRQARVVSSLLFRIVTLPLLVTLLCRSIPALTAARPMLEAMSVAIALVPFFAAWGRTISLRIALGRARADQRNWTAAERLLAPVGRTLAARLFDAAGEGRYHLALALEAGGRAGMAQRLFAQLAAEVGDRSEWGRLAIAAVTP